MIIKITSASAFGLEGKKVEVQMSVKESSFSSFRVVGLFGEEKKELEERVWGALKSLKKDFSSLRVIVKISPVNMPKEASIYDLPVALGILSFKEKFNIPPKSIFCGKLSSDGSLEHIKGSLLFTLFARKKGFKRIFLPASCAYEASAVKDINIYPTENLKEIVSFLKKEKKIKRAKYKEKSEIFSYNTDIKEIIKKENIKRAVEIAAGGNHNVVLLSGIRAEKINFARALSCMFPLLDHRESLEVTKIHSVFGNTYAEEGLVKKRPLRLVKPDITLERLIGGGVFPKPGEVTLSHKGILFLDRAERIPKSLLRRLRKPSKDGYVIVFSGKKRVVYPAKNLLVFAVSSCLCRKENCTCSKESLKAYNKKIKDFVTDKADMSVDFSKKEEISSLRKEEVEEILKEMKERVKRARDMQSKRFKEENIFTNSEMKKEEIKKYAFLEKKAKETLKKESSRNDYLKIIKVARTIADLEGKISIRESHIKEAINHK